MARRVGVLFLIPTQQSHLKVWYLTKMAGSTLTVLTSTISLMLHMSKPNIIELQFNLVNNFYSYGFCRFSISEELNPFGCSFLKKQLHLEEKLRNSDFKMTH